MHSSLAIGAIALLPSVLAQVSTSSKRGLVYVPNSKHSSDDNIWDSSTSDLTWYYNYGAGGDGCDVGLHLAAGLLHRVCGELQC